ncbi:MAG: hypothetical protein HC849_15215 [Oscillatoriales cyanobacterium RU_3_3]|nr:hypothetical protein [Microcoleus sp. SM1_3_4]NJM61243.1 hypothetical protein [Oscillatoriales cyanobacterium RU_3_3]
MGKLNSYDNIKTICGSWHINLSGFAAERRRKKQEVRWQLESGINENQLRQGFE